MHAWTESEKFCISEYQTMKENLILPNHSITFTSGKKVLFLKLSFITSSPERQEFEYFLRAIAWVTKSLIRYKAMTNQETIDEQTNFLKWIALPKYYFVIQLLERRGTCLRKIFDQNTANSILFIIENLEKAFNPEPSSILVCLKNPRTCKFKVKRCARDNYFNISGDINVTALDDIIKKISTEGIERKSLPKRLW